MFKRFKLIVIVFYTLNIFFFSFSSFISEIQESENVLFSDKYNLFLRQTGLNKLYSFFKVNLAYAFFGNGLYAGTYIEYTYFDMEKRKVVSTDLTEVFKSRNGQLRAGNVSTIISFHSLYRLRELNQCLDGLNKSKNVEGKQLILESIKKEEYMFSQCLNNIGIIIGESLQGWHSFEAKYYYIIPNDLSSTSDRRMLYLYKKLDFNRATNDD